MHQLSALAGRFLRTEDYSSILGFVCFVFFPFILLECLDERDIVLRMTVVYLWEDAGGIIACLWQGPTITKTPQEALCHRTLSSAPVCPMDLGWGFFASPMGYIFGDLGQGVHICGAVLPHEVILKISWFGCCDMLLPFSSPWYLFPFFIRTMGATAPVWPIPKVQQNKDHLSHFFRHQQHGWLGWAEQHANAQ